jgi:hypothetical protein
MSPRMLAAFRSLRARNRATTTPVTPEPAYGPENRLPEPMDDSDTMTALLALSCGLDPNGWQMLTIVQQPGRVDLVGSAGGHDEAIPIMAACLFRAMTERQAVRDAVRRKCAEANQSEWVG